LVIQVTLFHPRRAMDLTEDLHVHSTFSDGADTLEANLAAAESRGLMRLGCVDHVRAETTWVGAYVRSVHELRERTGVILTAGIEAKLLDVTGRLDLPANHDLADLLYIADHQFPWDDGPRSPRAIRAAIRDGLIHPGEAVDRLVEATMAAIVRHAGRPLVLAHLFSILPKIGADESIVPEASVRALGEAAARAAAVVEVSERWRCPSPRVARLLRESGARLACSTDSHRAATIGRYEYVATVAESLHAPA
jgi:putative hydrolase